MTNLAYSALASLLMRELERDDVVAGPPSPAATHRDRNELIAGRETVADRRCFGALGKGTMPQFVSSLHVVGVKRSIHRCTDEHDAACGDDRPTQVGRAPPLRNRRRQVAPEDTGKRA